MTPIPIPLILRQGLLVAAVCLLTACGRVGNDESAPIFPGEPHVDALSEALDISEIFGGVPEPRFLQLDYVQEFESATRRTPVEQYIQSVTPLNKRGPFATLRSEFQFTESKTTATEVQLQVADLLDLMSLVVNPIGDSGEAINRSYVELIERATGHLFPLRSGNRVDYTLIRKVQYDPVGRPRSSPRTLEFEYTLGVVGRLDPGIYPMLELVDPLWVINIEQIDPDGARIERQVYFSTEIGMPVYDERRNGSSVTRRRLVSWIPLTGERRGVLPELGDDSVEPDLFR